MLRRCAPQRKANPSGAEPEIAYRAQVGGSSDAGANGERAEKSRVVEEEGVVGCGCGCWLPAVGALTVIFESRGTSCFRVHATWETLLESIPRTGSIQSRATYAQGSRAGLDSNLIFTKRYRMYPPCNETFIVYDSQASLLYVIWSWGAMIDR